jgi:1-deoxy-D-xylulose-5-phosphate synthase
MEIMAAQDPAIVAITAAMQTGTGLSSFAARYPERFFDVGICEEHAVVFAAGLAAEGLVPVVAVYSTFAQRAVDCIIHDVCLQRLPVIFCLDRAGIVGDDGPTHHGVFDVALLRSIPNLTIMQPADGVEMVNMLYSATQWKRPTVIRYPRAVCPGFAMPDRFEAIECGKARVVREGWEIQIWALGDALELASGVADLLAAKGCSTGIMDARFVAPLDEDLLASQSALARCFLTLENGVAAGGFGSAVEEFLVGRGFKGEIVRGGWPREFVPHGSPSILMEKYGMTPEALADRVLRVLGG